MIKAPVNKIIPFSNVDGPGNRTALFFQGCSFACLYCHNPETIHLCRDCGACVPVCPAGALRMEEGKVRWDSKKCVQCDTCLKTCPELASPRVRWMSVAEVMTEITRAAPYISGITVSGGECSLRQDFLLELFPRVRALGKTCLMDSNGSLDFLRMPALMELCDGVMLDVKAAGAAWRKQLLGAEGDMPLRNLDSLLRIGKLAEVRTVLFPNRRPENEETIRHVCAQIGDKVPYRLIRYRPFGVRPEGLRLLGEECLEAEEAERYAALARSLGAAKAFVV